MAGDRGKGRAKARERTRDGERGAEKIGLGEGKETFKDHSVS